MLEQGKRSVLRHPVKPFMAGILVGSDEEMHSEMGQRMQGRNSTGQKKQAREKQVTRN